MRKFNQTVLALAVIGTLTAALTTRAAEPFLSPRARENQVRVVPDSAAKAKAPAMPCAQCKDEFTTRVDFSTRGASKPTFPVVKHLCEGCKTTLSTAGFGKGLHQEATHKCTSCGSENLACCDTIKGSMAATKGMEKQNVAPLK